jgi:translation initiation factor 2B subunit (eIF-2B alpha/beta/delta family)
MKENAERAISQIKILVNECRDLAIREQKELIAQLKEIENAITNLERAAISVPQELKSLKNKISVNLQKKQDQDHTLDYLKFELKELLTSIEEDKTIIAPMNNKRLPKVIIDDDEGSIRPSIRAAKRRK